MIAFAVERTDATILSGVNWQRVRAALKDCRESAGLGQVALARKVGVNKSTVNRIENVYGEPDHVPDLDTIERWVMATGQTLGSFFAQIEAPTKEGLKGAPLPTDNRAPRDEAVNEDGPTLSESAVGIEVLLGGLADTIDRAADRVVQSLERLTKARARQAAGRSRRDPRRRKAG